MPAKLPFHKWFWADWFQDTRCLSLVGRGLWIDLIGYLHEQTPKGVATWDIPTWCRLLTCTESEFEMGLLELRKFHVAEISGQENGELCIACRRTKREKKRRKYQSDWKAHTRDEQRGGQSVDSGRTAGRQPKHIHIQKQKHIQKQSQREEKKEEKKEETSTSAALPTLAAAEGGGKVAGSKSGPSWEAYATAYAGRYGVRPASNARDFSLLCRLVDKIGADDAPPVAAFYLTHNDPWYVRKMHPLTTLLTDANKLRTEWMTGSKLTTSAVKAAEQSDNLRSLTERVGQRLAERKAQGGQP